MKYAGAFQRWKRWALQFEEISVFPVKPMDFALFLSETVKKIRSAGPVESVFYGIKWAHRLSNAPDPTDHHVNKLIMESARRQLTERRGPKKAVTIDMLRILCDKYGKYSASLKDLRFLAMSLLAFAGFLRFNEVSNIRRSDLEIGKDLLRVLIRKSKTDVYKKGNSVHIVRTGTNTCPVKFLERYLDKAGLTRQRSQHFIFRAIRGKDKLNPCNDPITYSRAREVLMDYLNKAGFNGSDFGLHSFRSGGATAAASNGIGDRLLKQHGRWRSDAAKDLYVRDSLDVKLSVTKRLGM